MILRKCPLCGLYYYPCIASRKVTEDLNDVVVSYQEAKPLQLNCPPVSAAARISLIHSAFLETEWQEKVCRFPAPKHQDVPKSKKLPVLIEDPHSAPAQHSNLAFICLSGKARMIDPSMEAPNYSRKVSRAADDKARGHFPYPAACLQLHCSSLMFLNTG